MLTDAPEAHGWCTLRAVVTVTTACRVHHVCCGSSEFHANHGLLQPTVTICLNRNPLSLTGGRPQSRGNENPSSFAGPPCKSAPAEHLNALRRVMSSVRLLSLAARI